MKSTLVTNMRARTLPSQNACRVKADGMGPSYRRRFPLRWYTQDLTIRVLLVWNGMYGCKTLVIQLLCVQWALISGITIHVHSVISTYESGSPQKMISFVSSPCLHWRRSCLSHWCNFITQLAMNQMFPQRRIDVGTKSISFVLISKPSHNFVSSSPVILFIQLLTLI